LALLDFGLDPTNFRSDSCIEVCEPVPVRVDGVEALSAAFGGFVRGSLPSRVEDGESVFEIIPNLRPPLHLPFQLPRVHGDVDRANVVWERVLHVLSKGLLRTKVLRQEVDENTVLTRALLAQKLVSPTHIRLQTGNKLENE
jgi:hypothetical protein